MIFFRPVIKKDCDLLLIWRNDPTAYTNFIHANPVSSEEHERWFKKIRNDPNRFLYIIVKEDQQPIGQVRFDVEGNEAEISITIAKEFRGLGFGREAISLSSKFLMDNHKNVKTIYAKIKESNKASLKSFLNAGYKKFKKHKEWIYLKWG